MAYKSNSMFNQPKDAGWGLIYRLNNLWGRVDYRAEHGDYDGWEIVLDRIYANLLYRNHLELVENGTGEIIDVSLSKEDKKIRVVCKNKIAIAKLEIFNALKSKDVVRYKNAKRHHYEALMIYDVWVRKFMQEHQLYLREVEKNPGRSMWE